MKKLACVSVAVLLAAVAIVRAADIKSGLEPGAGIGAFQVVKVAGPEDGVSIGQELCYRCKYGARPMVMVFTRKTDEQLAALTRSLDEAVAKNSDKKLAAFINVMADSRDAADAAAKKFASTANAKNVPIVVPVEFENGPANYGINPKADVTVLIATGSKVTANHTFEKGLSCEACVEAVMADVKKLVQ